MQIPLIGFSTGALSLGDFAAGVRIVRDLQLNAIELSALRESELPSLIKSLDSLQLDSFEYVSVHAPSRYLPGGESKAAKLLEEPANRGWPIVIHPDAICDASVWKQFGKLVCVENMDKRKPVGRTRDELARCFENLPEASLCFDIGHAMQVDPTMIEAERILRQFGSRLTEVHLSEVAADSSHAAVSFGAFSAFRAVIHLIPPNVPLILEAMVPVDARRREIDKAKRLVSEEMRSGDTKAKNALSLSSH